MALLSTCHPYTGSGAFDFFRSEVTGSGCPPLERSPVKSLLSPDSPIRVTF
jgi:hypothetical protein